MRPAARLSAAIEIMDEWLAGRGAVDTLVAAWGRRHRFAGRHDRSAIADHVHTALRHKASAGALMGAGTGRGLVLGALALGESDGAARLGEWLAAGDPHGPAPLSPEERARITAGLPDEISPWVAGDYPSWLDPDLSAAWGDGRVREGRALAGRAPLDLRVNELKATREEARKVLADEGLIAVPTPFSSTGLRLPAGARAAATRAFSQGLVEIQDEGSQIACALAAPEPGSVVVDLCAGAGGKSLALAAAMGNEGCLYAFDTDATRLSALAPRAARAGVRIIASRLLLPERRSEGLGPLQGTADIVMIDAPCSGSGTWRRHPESKWRLRADHIEHLIAVQGALLEDAALLLKPSGRMVYVTCSVLPRENEAVVDAALEREKTRDLAYASMPSALKRARLEALAPYLSRSGALRLSPATTGTDGYFVALLQGPAARG